MTAIAAIFDRKNKGISRDLLQRVTNALKIYGPQSANSRIIDATGFCWTHQAGFFPQDRFERQPITAGRWSAVFAGYILYRAELAAKIGIDGARLKTMPDSALFLAAWQKWQEQAAEHVEGGYAAIISDNARNLVTAIRSPTDAPPLYYHETDDRVVIASMPKGLFAYGDVPRKLDEHKIADAMVLNYEINSGCYFEGLRYLRSGTFTTFTSQTQQTHKFFDIRRSPEIRFSKDQDYVEAANQLLLDAVSESMADDNIPAAHLSAGFDSSTVVLTMLDVLAQRGLSSQKIETYTHVPEPDWDGRAYGHLRLGDESDPVKSLAAKYPQINTHFVDCANIPLGGDVDKLFLLAEMPQRGLNNLHWGIEINRQIRASGKRLVLSGASGNATLSFDAKGLYGQWFRRGRWLKLWRELAADKTPGLKFSGLYTRAIAPNLPSSIARIIGSMRGFNNKTGWQGYSAIAPEYAQHMAVEKRAQDIGWDTSYAGFHDPREMMYTMLERGGREENGPMRLAMQTLTGVKTMDPMGDPRIIRFCAAIPPEQFLKNGNHRYLITRMMKGRLPDAYFLPQRGRQTADWHLKMTRDLHIFRDKVARMKDDPDMAQRFDVARLEKLLDSWPDKTPLSSKDHPDFALAMVGLGRATNMADFINWAEGKNR